MHDLERLTRVRPRASIAATQTVGLRQIPPSGVRCELSSCEVTINRWRHKSIPWQVCILSKSLVLLILTFATLRSRQEAALFFPRVMMASEWKGSRPSHLMIIPNTKSHPNNTKTDQSPIGGVITAFQGRATTTLTRNMKTV